MNQGLKKLSKGQKYKFTKKGAKADLRLLTLTGRRRVRALGSGSGRSPILNTQYSVGRKYKYRSREIHVVQSTHPACRCEVYARAPTASIFVRLEKKGLGFLKSASNCKVRARGGYAFFYPCRASNLHLLKKKTYMLVGSR